MTPLALPGIGNYTVRGDSAPRVARKNGRARRNVARVLARLGAIHGDSPRAAAWRVAKKRGIAGSNHNHRALGTSHDGTGARCALQIAAMPACRSAHSADRAAGWVSPGSLPEKRTKRATVEVTRAAVGFADGKGQTLLGPREK